jgi:hypothetical protein
LLLLKGVVFSFSSFPRITWQQEVKRYNASYRWAFKQKHSGMRGALTSCTGSGSIRNLKILECLKSLSDRNRTANNRGVIGGPVCLAAVDVGYFNRERVVN